LKATDLQDRAGVSNRARFFYHNASFAAYVVPARSKTTPLTLKVPTVFELCWVLTASA